MNTILRSISHWNQIFFFPTLWKTISQGFFRAFVTTLFTLVAILLTTKIEEVARFISLGASWYKITLFIVYQIPYLVQIAIPLSAIWASYTYFNQLNGEYQITALRSLGFSLKEILFPLAISSALLSFSLFFVFFDLGANSHLLAKKLEFDVRYAEPLALLHTSQHLKGSQVAFDLKGSLKRGAEARDLFVCMPRGDESLILMLAKDLQYKGDAVNAESVTIINTTALTNDYADLAIENARKVSTPSDHLYELTGAKSWKIAEDHMPLRILLTRQDEISQEMSQLRLSDKSTAKLEKKSQRITSEIARRISLSIACFTLALVGAVCAIHTGRNAHTSGLRCVLYTGIFIVCYLAAKSVDDKTVIATTLFLLPHIILLKILLHRVQVIEEGQAG